ncbi:MAG: T9SS type A sorting domain-containing protein [Rubricoccaceae bacterium]|nr:T9SS type A sorting domain-containing protein [Rubricoccaceae bacterium]
MWLLLLLAAVAPAGAVAQSLPPSRAFEPVVVTGDALTPLAGATPTRVAAFRYQDEGWVPVPVQVDEREALDLAWVYNGRENARCAGSAWCFDRGSAVYTVYTDPGTFTGADSDPFVDPDDEVVFMAQDAGQRAPSGVEAPPGALGSSGVEVAVRVPGDDEPAYIYLFWHDGRYPGDAGRPYVDYRFELLSGDYLATYDLKGVDFGDEPVGEALGANPEDTEVVTAYYRRHFSDRWIEDGLEVYAGGATGVDLLDRWKIQPEPGDCYRSEYTGSAGRGAFIANRSGPVRGIRSVLGFNSGHFMQQDILFYERHIATTFYHRGHSVESGPLGYNDYSAAATGMLRYSNLDPEGFLLDGQPEQASEGELAWEMVQGEQGTIVLAYDISTDIPWVEPSSYYHDEAPAAVRQCTGDAALYGASGVRVTGRLPNTDPTIPGELYRLRFERQQLHAAPDLPLEEAQAFVTATDAPLDVEATPFALVLGEDPRPSPTPPEPFALDAPRPNPSSGLARITYRLDAQSSVRLTVYDLVGRRVAVLDEGRREAGYHDVPLGPDRFPAGVYIIRLESPRGMRAVPFVRR